MESSPTITRSPMPVVEEAEGIGDEFERRRTNALGFPINIETAARPMFCREDGKPPLQEAAVEIRIMGDDEHYPPQQIVDGAIVDAVIGDHLIGNAGNVRDEGYGGRSRSRPQQRITSPGEHGNRTKCPPYTPRLVLSRHSLASWPTAIRFGS